LIYLSLHVYSFLDGNVSTSEPVVLGSNDKTDTNVTNKTWNPPMAMEKSSLPLQHAGKYILKNIDKYKIKTRIFQNNLNDTITITIPIHPIKTSFCNVQQLQT
jgi:hypothetical protein